MRNLLLITQKVDTEDDLLGFFVDWIQEFSKKFDKVFVITLAKGNYKLPPNVHVYSLGKERGNSKIARLFNFYKYLFQLIPKSNGIFAHMSPIFVVASWPVAFVFGKKIIFWYLHRSVTARLRLAEKLSYKIVTAASESLKFNSDKIIEVGHGINLETFKTQRNWNTGKFRILSVGRISKIKNYDTLLEAARIMKEKGIDFEIKIIGQPVMGPDADYLNYLRSMNEKLNLGDRVGFVGFVPHSKVSQFYKESDLVVGLTPDGGVDKTILEGMASGCLVLTSNNVNEKYFLNYAEQLIFNYRDPNDLADKITTLSQLSQENKKNISNFLVESVSSHHRLENAINRISSLL